MSLQLSIRKYEEKDFERLCQVHDPARKSELEYAGLPAAFLPLSIAAEREGLFEYQVYVAEDKGLVVGFIAFSDTELAWLYVDRSCARQGVGSELMRFALERVQDDAEIEVLDGNEPALALYAKFGFTTVRMVTGVMPGNESFPVTVHVLERQEPCAAYKKGILPFGYDVSKRRDFIFPRRTAAPEGPPPPAASPGHPGCPADGPGPASGEGSGRRQKGRSGSAPAGSG